MTKEQRKNLSIAHTGKQAQEKNAHWKGENASYSAKHYWVTRKRGKPTHCEECGLDRDPRPTKVGVKRKNYFQWANISGKYKRDLLDYRQMCTACHLKFDSKQRNMNIARGEDKYNAVLNNKIVLEIKALSLRYRAVDIAKKLGINRRTCADVINNKTWKHIK